MALGPSGVSELPFFSGKEGARACAWFPGLRFCPVQSLDFPGTPASSNVPLCPRVAAFYLQSLPW